MTMSRAEYYRSVLDQVLVALRIHPYQKHRPFDTLRQQVEALPEDRRLTAGVADFWLDLGPKLGRTRRQDAAVHNPFYPDGRKVVAAKSQIAAWDDQWRKLEAAKLLRSARTAEAQAIYGDLTVDPCPWMIGFADNRELVIGHACWLPDWYVEEVLATNAAGFDIQWLRPTEALRLAWHDRGEASTWLAIVRACHRMQEAELERIRLELDTPQAFGKQSDGPRI